MGQVEVDVQDALEAARTRIAALEADRNYWRAQHDLVMIDWKADCDSYEARLAARPPVAVVSAPPSAAIEALKGLLRFYDPEHGAVHGQKDGQFLSDAFARAVRALEH
jgi:hypothetical protein